MDSVRARYGYRCHGRRCFAGVDAAATSVGFPIRNMHTISESGHTGDVLAAVHGMFHMLQAMEERKLTAEDFRGGHPRLDEVAPIAPVDPSTLDESESEEDEEE